MLCITEYNEAETMQMFKQEGIEEGRQEGLQTGLRATVSMLKTLLPDFGSVLKTIHSTDAYSDVSNEDVRKYYDMGNPFMEGDELK